MKRRALITGASGQLGRELAFTAPDQWTITALPSTQLDITSFESVAKAVGHTRPDVILNAAAYTAVDKAESDKERAFEVNEGGVENVARAARQFSSRVIHVSTDFVFDGAKGSPYLPDDDPDPLGVYGASKLAGEQRLRETLPETSLVVRTAWLYSAYGSNFVRTILRLLRERDELSVVADQIGSPTWARSLARVLWAAAERPGVNGIVHWTDAGQASWYDFAVGIEEEALKNRLVSRKIPIRPITTAEYPTAARRPSYSVLDGSHFSAEIGITPKHWRANLSTMMRELADSSAEQGSGIPLRSGTRVE